MILDENKFITLLNRQQESGLSVKDFCSNEGIAKSSFYYWKKKLRRNPRPKRFIPLMVESTQPVLQKHSKGHQIVSTGHAQIQGDLLLEVVYPNGTMVRIKKDIDLTMLKTLIYLYE